eukprot:scaffold3690_cov113-Isochrysis_galbana.AAC.5
MRSCCLRPAAACWHACAPGQLAPEHLTPDTGPRRHPALPHSRDRSSAAHQHAATRPLARLTARLSRCLSPPPPLSQRGSRNLFLSLSCICTAAA